MSQMRDISVDKIFTFDDVDDEPHNGKPITMIEISPNENYFITYSERDSSIVGWNVEDIDKGQLKVDKTVKINHGIKSLCVSDNKKLAYICRGDNFVIDMDNKDKNIALSFYGRKIKKLFGFILHKLKMTNGNVRDFTGYLKIMN
ncbi:hypothetical protein RhiirA1_476803 [Rhizophagus irregularis]|uniref:Uncharacterized protein n=1 Tax=Rhizophagus irregularis TaxID=588596 RepID=A0A2N0QUJ6_9GLOM|nr:hypothetical protein RhiirA1_476803 [Rhizophagus irregularis]